MANTHSTDLQDASTQFWSINDGDQTGLQAFDDITLEAWIKIDRLPSTATHHMTIIGKYYSSNTDREWMMQLRTDDTIRFYYSSDGQNRTYIASTAAIVDGDDVGVWVHIALSCDISAKTGNFYKNATGVNTDAGVGIQTAIKNGASMVVIGANDNGLADYMDGKVDEVRVWSDVRTPTEISDNYDSELVGNEAGLVGYWKFSNNGLDETANDNDLTNNNVATFSSDVPFDATVATDTGNMLLFF